MINWPLDLNNGFNTFSSIYDPEQTNIVVIPSTNTYPAQDLMIQLLKNRGYDKNIYRYTPPGTVSHKGDKNRRESVPAIKEPTYACIIIDDIIEDGNTLSVAVNRLSDIGTPEDQIYPYISTLFIDERIRKRVTRESGVEEPMGPFFDVWSSYKQIFDKE